MVTVVIRKSPPPYANAGIRVSTSRPRLAAGESSRNLALAAKPRPVQQQDESPISFAIAVANLPLVLFFAMQCKVHRRRRCRCMSDRRLITMDGDGDTFVPPVCFFKRGKNPH